MANLSEIKKDSNWGEAASTINSNFQNMNVDLEKVKSSTTKFKGYFTTETALKEAYPSPKVGETAWVGSTYPGMVYDVQTDGAWHNTGKAPDTDSVDLTDYARKEELTEVSNKVAGINYVTCDTAASTAAKTVSITGLTSLTTGIRLLVKMTNNNTASNATLNINSLGAKPLYYDNERASSDNSWEAGEVIDIYYDGTNFYSGNVQGGSSDGGNKTLTWNTDAATTRKQVQLKDRKELLQISYKDGEGNSINEQYIGTAFDDTSWADDSNWKRVYDSQYHPVVESLTGTANFTSGYRVDANTGELKYTSEFKSCEVRVEGYDNITTDVAYSQSGTGIAFYDKEGTYISGFSKSVNYYGENLSIDIPENAVTAKWSWSDSLMAYQSDGKYILSIKESIPSEYVVYNDETQKDFNDRISEFIENKSEENVATSVTLKLINASTGEITSNDSWKYFEANVNGHKKLYCKVGFSNNKTLNVGLAFYDETDTYISGYYKLIYEGTEDVGLDIPDNAVTARWSWIRSNEENNGEYRFDSELHIDASKVRYGEQTQSEFNDSISNKDFTEKTYVAGSTYNYFINASNGNIINSSAWKYFEADVEDCKEITCKVGFASSSNNVGLAFYDDSDTFISGYYVLNERGWENVTMEIPENAVTARWSWLSATIGDHTPNPYTSNNGEYTVTKKKSLSDDSDVIDHYTVNLLVADQLEKTFNDGVNDFTPPNDGYSMSNPIDARAGDWFTRTGTETGMIVVTDENDTNGQRLYKSNGSTLGASFQIPKDLDWVRYIRLAVEDEGANDGSVVICKGKYAFTGSEKGDFLTIPKLRVEKRNLTNDLLYIQNEDGSKNFKIYVDTDGNIKAKEVELAISDSELPTNWKKLTLQGSFNGYFDRFVIMNTDFLIDLSEDGPMKIKAISPALTSTYSNFEHFYTSSREGRYVVDTLQNVVTNGKGITIFDDDFNAIETNITGGDIHDFVYIDDEHMIILSNQSGDVDIPDIGTTFIDGIVAEEWKKNNGKWKKIGRFAAVNYPKLCTDAFGDLSKSAIDNHQNTIGLDYDGNLILNMRNWDSFIKIKRTEKSDGTVTLGSDTYDYDEAIIGRVGGRRNSGYIDSKRVLPEGFSYTDVPQSLTEVSDDDWEDWQWFHCHDVKYWGMKNIDGQDYPTYTLFDNNMRTGAGAPAGSNATNKHNDSATDPNGDNNVSRVVQISIDWDNHLIKDYRVYVIPKMYSSEQGGATMYEEGVISISYSYQGTFGLWDFRTASTQVSGNVYTGAKQLFLGKYTSYGYCYRANTYKIE